MKEYERIQQERESRINRIRIARALYEYIGGTWSKPEPISPTVKRLAEMLHYMPEQLITDTKDMYAAITDSLNYGALLDRLTARADPEHPFFVLPRFFRISLFYFVGCRRG